MSKFWDIIPPHPPTYTPKRSSKPKRQKNVSVFFGLVIMVLISIFIYSAMQNKPINVDGAATHSPQKSPTDQPSTSPTQKNRSELLIKILNGSGRSEETANVTNILKNSDFNVAKKENALNSYDQTIVYFEPHQEKYAEEIAQNLAKYQAKIQQFSQDSPYDLIVVIGAR